MKTLLTLTFALVLSSACAQADQKKTLEHRARSFYEAIQKDDKAVWQKFMEANFTKALIERPMRAQVSTTQNDGIAPTTTSDTRLEEKLAMFERLHDDFGKSKITSITVTGNHVEMRLTTDSRMFGVFSFDATNASPWQIDKMGISVEAEN